jgi:hypothetical protein
MNTTNTVGTIGENRANSAISTISVTSGAGNSAFISVPIRTSGDGQAQTVHNISAGEPRSAGRGRLSPSQTRQFEKMILPHEGSLFGPAMALTRSASDAEDLVQDTLLRAYDRFETFRADGSPRAWLHTIMRNLFYNAFRPGKRGQRGSGGRIAAHFAPPTNRSKS